MRPLLPALACLALSAQTPEWTAYVENWKRTSHPPLTLLASEAILPDTFRRREEGILILTACGDLQVSRLTAAEATRLAKARSGSGLGWILLNARGEVVDEGTTLPSGDTLKTLLLAQGSTPRWESVETFLHEHPDHGEALEARLFLAVRIARARFLKLQDEGKASALAPPSTDPQKALIQANPIPNPEDADRVFLEVTETLQKLARLPDAWRSERMALLDPMLKFTDPAASPQLRSAMHLLAERLLEAWSQDPGSAELSSIRHGDLPQELGPLWLYCEQIAQGRPPSIPALSPVPDHTWPPMHLLVSTCARYQSSGDWEGLLAYLDAVAPDPIQPRDPPTRRVELMTTRFMWLKARAEALGNLERWGDAMGSLQELRDMCGPLWTGIAAEFRHGWPLDPSKPGPKPTKAMMELLAEPPQPDPPRPVSPSCPRLVTWDLPSAARKMVQSSEWLAPWGPDELHWEVASPEAQQRMSSMGLKPPCWGLFQDASTLVTGRDGMDPLQMAHGLAMLGPSKLQKLDAFIQSHPDHKEARRLRYRLLQGQLPHLAFEPSMIEDAAIAELSFEPQAPYILRPERWAARAMRTLPDLEAALQRWPNNHTLWRSWLSWNAFRVKPLFIADFAENLSTFGRKSAFRAQLPFQVHEGVLRQCREQKKPQAMREWFQLAFEGLQSVPETDVETRIKQEGIIHEGLVEALKTLGDKGALAEIEKAWQQRQLRRPQPKK